MAENLGEQVALQEKINKLLVARSKLLAKQGKLLTGQVGLAVEMCNALECKELDGMADRLSEIRDAMDDAADSAGEMGDKISEAGNAAKKAAKQTEKGAGMFDLAKVGAVGFGVGAVSAFKSILNIGKGVLSFLGSVVSSFFDIAKAIVSLPFKVLSGLIEMANEAAGAMDEFKNAQEDVKEQFGKLSSNEGKAVIDMYKDLRSNTGKLLGAGKSFYKVFGPGPGGMAAALKFAQETAGALGPELNYMMGEFKKNGAAIGMYAKGLGISNEHMQAMAKHARISGKSLTDQLNEVGSMSIQMGKQFGMSSKLIAQGMTEMSADFTNFGNIAKKEIAAAVVFAGKLGIEVKDFMGVLDKFDNFEDAATGAAKLSQAFGMNLDAMKLMNEQNPAKRIDMLREAFFATGKSIETMTRQEKKLLEAQTGLTGAALEGAFAQKNMGLSYEDIEAGADQAADKQLTQAEAMKELADAIKLTHQTGKGSKSFTESLFSGFVKGMSQTKEFRQMLQNLRASMHEVYKFGKRLGKDFVNFFPGIKQVIKGIRDLFDPRVFRRMLKKVQGAFRQFFKDLHHDPKAGVQTLLKSLGQIFKEWFSEAGPAASSIGDGLKKIGAAILGIIAGLIPYIMNGLANMINAIADFIRDPSAVMDSMSEMGDSMSLAFAQVGESLAESWPVLKDAFGNLFSAISEKIWPALKPYAMKAMEYVMYYVLIVASLSAIKAMAVTAVVKGIGGFFKKMMGGAAKEADKAADQIPSKSFSEKMEDFMNGLEKLDAGTIAKAAAIMVVLTTVALVAMYGMAHGLMKILEVLAPLAADPCATIIKLAALYIGVKAVTSTMNAISYAYQTYGAEEAGGTIMKALGLLLASFVAVGLIGLGIALLVNTVPPMDPVALLSFSGAMIVGLIAAAGMLKAAQWADKAADGKYMQIIKGMAMLGGAMIAIGVIGGIVGGMLSLFDNPEGIAMLMNAISKMMAVTALMLPIAVGLGFMVMIPFAGGATVAAAIIGFGVIGGLASAMVGSLVPAMRAIAGINVGDPKSFKMVTEALLAVIQAIEGFVNAVARVMEALRPGLADLVAGKSMEDNIKAATDFVDAVLKNGILPLIDKIIAIAENTKITKSGLETVKALGVILKAIGTILQAMQPDPDMIKAVAAMDSWYSSGNAVAMMEQLNKWMKQMYDSAIGLLTYVANCFFSSEFLGRFKGVDPNAAKVIAAFGPIMEGIAKALDALKPSDEQMKAVQAASLTWGPGGGARGGARVMNAMTRYMKAMDEPIKTLIDAIGTNLVSVVNSIRPIIKDVAKMKVDPEVIGSVADIVAAVMNAMGSLMSNVFPMFKEMMKQTEKYSDATTYGIPKRIELLNKMMSNTVEAMLRMGPTIKKMTLSLLDTAKSIQDPKKVKDQISAVAAAFDIVTMLTDTFAGKDAALNAYAYSHQDFSDTSIGALEHNLEQFNKVMLKTGGPLETFIAKLSSLTVPKGGEKRAKAVAGVFKAFGEIMTGIEMFKKMAPKDATASNNDSGAMEEINQAIRFMKKIDFDGVEDVMGKVAGIKYINPKVIDNRAKMAEHYSDFITEIYNGGTTKDLFTYFHKHAISIEKFKMVTNGEHNIKTIHHIGPKWYTNRIEMAQLHGELMRMLYDDQYGANVKDIYTYFPKHSITIEKLADFVTTSMPNFDIIKNNWNKASVESVKQIIDETNELTDLMANLKPINIDKKLSKFARNIRVDRKTLRIKHKPINITINLSLKLDADELTQHLGKATNKSRKYKVVYQERTAATNPWGNMK